MIRNKEIVLKKTYEVVPFLQAVSKSQQKSTSTKRYKIIKRITFLFKNDLVCFGFYYLRNKPSVT